LRVTGKTSAPARLRDAVAADWPAIAALLKAAALPIDDLAPSSVEDFIVAIDDDGVRAAVAVQRFDDHGLLRSLAVEATARNRGLGRALATAAEARARRQGLKSLTLLTETAAGLFSVLGYRSIAREEAPDAVRQSRQFTQLCPSTSTCMTRSLSDAPLRTP
jgi:amino-acid N-acetyltransferase